MTPVLLLSRHGNTFEKGDRIVMVGAGEDPPLTDEGIRQARETGVALARENCVPIRVVGGPLRRTRVYAETLSACITGAPAAETDNRLCELDYGHWSGLTSDEIAERYGNAELDAWNDRDVWPQSAGFSPSEADVRAELTDFLGETSRISGLSIAVTSNGRLRIFGQLCGGAGTAVGFKMKTGHSSLLVHNAGAWRICAWNISPLQLARELQRDELRNAWSS